MFKRLSILTRIRLFVKVLGFWKIPMLGYACPKIVSVDDEQASVFVPLKRRTKNHWGTMYLGALAVGADLAAGLHAFYFAEKEGVKLSFAFKTFTAEFLKRPDSGVTFVTNDGLRVAKALQNSIKTGERVNQQVSIDAFNDRGEKVAVFELTASVKIKKAS